MDNAEETLIIQNTEINIQEETQYQNLFTQQKEEHETSWQKWTQKRGKNFNKSD